MSHVNFYPNGDSSAGVRARVRGIKEMGSTKGNLRVSRRRGSGGSAESKGDGSRGGRLTQPGNRWSLLTHKGTAVILAAS